MTAAVADIADSAAYSARMRKSLIDKAFFLDKVDGDVFIDYGCADGSLIHFMHWMFPEHTYIGYDIDPAVLYPARWNAPQASFYSDRNVLNLALRAVRGRKVLILSSVIHEVLSYGMGLNKLWSEIAEINPDTIVIRDMMVRRDTESGIASPFQFTKVMAYAHSMPDRLARFESFEAKWGSITTQKNLIHYLLKYRYVENWAREVNENYLPLSVEDFESCLPSDYEVTFKDHFTLPFLRRSVEHDFDIRIDEPTHLKLILERA